MNRKIAPAMTLATMLTLTACAGPPTLDTDELRAEAVETRLGEVAHALSTYDVDALKKLQCAEPYLVDLPRKELLPPGVELPLTVEATQVEPLDLADSTYTDPDSEAEFLLASMNEVSDDADPIGAMLPDVVIRVDSELACVWAMGPPFALLMGL